MYLKESTEKVEISTSKAKAEIDKSENIIKEKRGNTVSGIEEVEQEIKKIKLGDKYVKDDVIKAENVEEVSSGIKVLKVVR